jgi:hypothetical protein
LNTIDAVADEGNLAPGRAMVDELELEPVCEPIVLPDGRRIYPHTCAAGRSMSWPARCWTWKTRAARRSRG